MAAPVVIDKFNESNQFSLNKLNSNFQSLVATINAIAADTLLQFGVSPGNQSDYMPVVGGSFQGQITAPSVLVGPVGGSQYNVITTNDTATTTAVGVVKQATAVVDLNQTIAGPTVGEVQAISDKVDEILAALRTAGVLAP